MPASLQCTFDDARRNHLRDGIALSTAAKVAFFEEMVSLAIHFGARDRLADGRASEVLEKYTSGVRLDDSLGP